MAAYSQSAAVYDALCRHKDYAAASHQLRYIIARLLPDAKSLLDVACGTGQHLSYLRSYFSVEGLDSSVEMLEIARRRCPDVSLHCGSMIDFQLSGRFDVITCLFGSIGYVATVLNLERTIENIAGHLAPRAVLLMEPWLTPARFVSGIPKLDIVNEPDLKVARMYITRREGLASVFDSEYLVATANGVTHFRERQELGLFTDEEYRRAFGKAGLEVVEAGDGPFGYGLYVCARPRGAGQPNG